MCFQDIVIFTLYHVSGFASIALGLWLNLAILMTNLSDDLSYRNLANFTVVACVRRMVPLIAYMPLFSFIERYVK